MKALELFEHKEESKRIDWIDDPNIGWFMESDPVRLYYGANKSQLKDIFKNGIYADDTGYIRCALEPYTANYQAMPLTESKENDDRVVLVIDIPASFSNKKPFYVESEKITDKKLYESWGKSDVEFYALANIEVPSYIPSKYIKGYMVKNDS